MGKPRLLALQEILAADPNDSFARYGIAQELVKSGDLARATEMFEDLRRRDPEYVATYYHLGKTYEKLGRRDDAARAYREGIAAAARRGDQHAKSELGDALDLMGEP